MGQRRYVIAVGVARYDHLPAEKQLASVENDVELITDWFSRHGFDHVLPALCKSPSLDTLRNQLGRWFSDPDRTSNDLVVFYYSGHGESVDNDGHYFLARDSYFDAQGALVASSAYADTDVAKLLSSSLVQHALFIFDACYSGDGITGMSAKAGKLLSSRAWVPDAPHGIYLISASRPREIAQEHVFANALVSVMNNADEQCAGRLLKYLDPQAMVRVINDSFRAKGIRQEAAWLPATALRGDPPQLIPNPLYKPVFEAEIFHSYSVRDDNDSDASIERRHFTGRERALRELTDWLTQTDDVRARIVTGGPGTGKSAVLRQWVRGLSSSIRFLYLSARNKTISDLRDAIAAFCGKTVNNSDDLVEVLNDLDDPLLIVVDTLDEAKGGTRKIAGGLLRAITSQTKIRLLVSTRPEVPANPGRRRVNSLGTATVEIDFDDASYMGPRDVETFATRWLLGQDDATRRTCYRARQDLVTKIAPVVARKAGLVFLVARIGCDNLASASAPIDLSEPNWEQQIPAGAGLAFQQYLDRFDADDNNELSTVTVVDLLRPLAYAEGEGLPRGGNRPLWAALASALSGKEYIDEDISALLKHASGYIVESTEHGRSAYRLYHEALADWLRADRVASEAQRAIYHALMNEARAERPYDPIDWTRADSYLRSHLISHAFAAGRLEALIADPMFVAASDIRRVLPLLSHVLDRDSRAAAHVYLRAAHHLQAAPWEERLSYLELTALQRGLPELASHIRHGPIAPAWRPLWTTARSDCPHRLIGQHEASVRSVIAASVNGIPTIVSAGNDGLCAFSLIDGSAIRHRIDNVWSLAVVQCEAAQVVVAGCYDGTVHFWDPVENREVRAPLVAHTNYVRALAVYQINESTPLIVSGGGDGYLRIWDLAAEQQFGNDIFMFSSSVQAVLVAEMSGEPVIVASGDNGKDTDGPPLIAIYTLRDQRLIATPQTRAVGFVRSLALATNIDPPMLLAGRSDRTVERWDWRTTARCGGWAVGSGVWVESIAVASVTDRHIAIVTEGTTIVIRDLLTNEQIGGVLDAHAAVHSVQISELHGRQIIVAGGQDGGVRLWDLEDALSFDGATATPAPERTLNVSAGRFEGQDVIACGQLDGLRVVNLESGVEAWKVQNIGDYVTSSTILDCKTYAIIAAGTRNGLVHAWRSSPSSGTKQKVLADLISGNKEARAMTVARFQREPVLVVGSTDGSVCVFSLTTGLRVGDDFVPDMRGKTVETIAAYEDGDGDSIVISGGGSHNIVISRMKSVSGKMHADEIASHKHNAEARHYDHIRSIAIGDLPPHGRVLVSGSDDLHVRLWSLPDLKPIGEPFEGHRDWLSGVGITTMDEASVIVSCAKDRQIRVWNAAGNLLHRIDIEEEPLDLAVGPRGAIAICTKQGTMVLQLRN